MKILWGISGSFCNHDVAMEQMEAMVKKGYDIQVILSENAATLSTRYGTAQERISRLEQISGKKVFSTLVEAEQVGPILKFDYFIIAPMTATVLSKLAQGIYDNTITLAVKAMLRNKRPVVVGIASNDFLGISGQNLMQLKLIRHIYFVPFYQDDMFNKENSLISKWSLIEETLLSAQNGQQLQPILLTSEVKQLEKYR